MEALDRNILNNIQAAFPLALHPYRLIGKDVGISEEEAWQRVRALRENGIIRRTGGIFDSRRLGYVSTLCAAEVPNTRVPVVAELIEGIDGITHNYLRNHPKYNMWFTIIASAQQQIESIILDIQAALGSSGVYSLPAIQVFKLGAIFNLGANDAQGQSRKIQIRPPVNAGINSHPTTTKKDKKLVRLLQEDLPYSMTPYSDLADQLRIDTQVLLAGIQRLLDRGMMRRLGTVLAHRKSGFSSNAMGVWVVPEERVNETGLKMSKFREVTHCYHRQTFYDWPYNLFSMVHGHSDQECLEIMGTISEATGINNYALLFSDRELKKTSMRYFNE